MPIVAVRVSHQTVAVDDDSKARMIFRGFLRRITKFPAQVVAYAIQTSQHLCFCVLQLMFHLVGTFTVDDNDVRHFVSQKLAAVTDVDCRFYTATATCVTLRQMLI